MKCTGQTILNTGSGSDTRLQTNYEKIMTYTEAEKFIKKSHDKEIRLGLDRIAALLDKLGNPQNSLKFIHVAGTNGKGSVCMMTAEILQRAGYKTGLFTSPVISDYREQFRINGEMIPEEDFIRLTQVVKSGCDLLADPPSEFEKATALAFLYFKESFCDFVVLEVGMGGKDDATNVIGTPEVAAIVTIDYDHMGFLGKTLTQIAEKKAGIIKEAGHVVIAEQDEAVMRVLKERCLEKKALISMTSVSDIKMTGSSLAGQSFDYKTYQGVRLSLLGSHQCENAAVVLEIIDCLLAKGYNIKKSAVYEGLRNVHWPGRFEVISQDPLFILDGAHNPNGINALSRNLREYFPGKKFVFLVGILRDKDYHEMLLKMMPEAAGVVTIAPDNPRAMSAHECADAIRACDFEGEILESTDIGHAVSAAIRLAEEKNTGVCAFGSLYSVGHIKAVLEKEEVNG